MRWGGDGRILISSIQIHYILCCWQILNSDQTVKPNTYYNTSVVFYCLYGKIYIRGCIMKTHMKTPMQNWYNLYRNLKENIPGSQY